MPEVPVKKYLSNEKILHTKPLKQKALHALNNTMMIMMMIRRYRKNLQQIHLATISLSLAQHM